MPRPRSAANRATLNERIESLFSSPSSPPSGEIALTDPGQAPTANHSAAGVGAGRARFVDAVDGTAHFVTFRLGDRLCAVPLSSADRILRMVSIIPIPEEPPWIAGAINMHGRVVPVLHLGKRLGYTNHRPRLDDRLVVIRAANGVAALIVDDVTEIAGVPETEVVAPPEPLCESPFLYAVIRRGESLVMVIDVARIIHTAATGSEGAMRIQP